MVDLPEDIIHAAQDSEKRWGIPASVSLAQYGLESGWGKHIPEGSNNPFGMKVRANSLDPFVTKRTREVDKAGKEYYVSASFRKFTDMAEAFDAHGELLATAPVYSRARSVLPDPVAFAHALTGVYATDPNYGTLLETIMRQSGLMKYNVAPTPAIVSSPPLAMQAIQAIGGVPTNTVLSKATTAAAVATTIIAPNTTATRIKRALSGWQGNVIGAVGVAGGLLLDPTFSAALGRFTTAIASGSGRWGAVASLIGTALIAYRSKVAP